MRYGSSTRSLSYVSTERSDKRLSAKTNLKLAKLWLDRGEFARLTKVGSYDPAYLSWFQSPVTHS